MSTFLQVILYVGAIQGILLSLFLFSVKSNRISNRLLGLLTLLWGIFLLAYGLQFVGLYSKFPHFIKVFYQFLFVFFPLLYLQVKYLVSDYKKFQKRDFIHFLPLVISILLYSDFFIQPAEIKLQINAHKSEYYHILQILGDEFVAFQGIIYSVAALLLLNRYRKKIQDYESTTEKKLIAVQNIGISLNLFSWIIGTIGIQFFYFHVKPAIDLFTMSYLVMVVVIYVISFAAIKSPEIFKLKRHKIKIIDLADKLSKNESTTPDDKLLQDTELMELDKRLQELMENKKPYLNPELTLSELAELLNTSRSQLSNVINQLHEINFYKFINQYRVEEVKKIMQSPENESLKLISIAYDAGFNSKASFNRIFKQMTGMTPSEYLANIKALQVSA
jgi:AraC-like DNA-binding protein